MTLLRSVILFDGLGTHWECEVIGQSLANDILDKLKTQLVTELNRFTKTYSRFDDGSLISQLNRQSKLINPPAEMCNMFQFAKAMYAASDGAFNISVGGVLHAKGYGKTNLAAKAQPDFWQSVTVNSAVIVIPDGSVVDFGGFGKGWLIDKFVEIFRANKIYQFIINGGGDLYVQSNEPIEILLEHSADSSKKIGQTKITQGALAASSTLKRAWRYNGNKYNHIIDPVSGQSIDSAVVGTFVKADTALIADTMATILLVRPDMDEVLSKKYNLQTILLTKNQIKN